MRQWNGSRVTRIAAVSLLLATCSCQSHSQPTLRITSPKDRVVVHPGESLTVVVEATPGRAFDMVTIVGGPDPLALSPGFNRVLTAPPYRFTIQLPNNIPVREYDLSADGTTGPGHGARSDPITIRVERADTPQNLSVYPTEMRLSPGHKGFLSVTGLFADGASVDLTKSTLTKYKSDATGVATVQSEGIVTAVAPGAATIIVTNGRATFQIPVTVSRENPHD